LPATVKSRRFGDLFPHFILIFRNIHDDNLLLRNGGDESPIPAPPVARLGVTVHMTPASGKKVVAGVLQRKEHVQRMIDAERLSKLFHAHAAQLTLYAQWLDAGAGEDVVQEAYIRLMSQKVEPENVKGWLFTTVRNEAISQTRSLIRRRRHERSDPRSQWFEPTVADAIDATAATEALQSLPAAQREVIVLRIWGQMTLKEVAEITGSSISTLFDQYRAGLTALRQKMGAPCHNNNH
jgi:RNA polymerase sigma factor (sigma-70 family)